ncbi:MAG: hypothetical protein MZU97_19660 [Bacillus subtilis]|nr:hypothetical protein [Bacillus subtilis]
MAILVLDANQKEVGSTEAMRRTVSTAPTYPAWVKQSFADAEAFETALKNNDFSAVGRIAERNALALHAVCEAQRSADSLLDRTFPRDHIRFANRANRRSLRSLRDDGRRPKYQNPASQEPS